MSSHDMLVPPIPAPNLNIPNSLSTVEVRIIDTAIIIGRLDFLVESPIKGHKSLGVPSYIFLISHGPTKTHHLFDHSVRKDPLNLAPALVKRLFGRDGKSGPWKVDVKTDAKDFLENDASSLRIRPTDISSIIWSHIHFDHTGDNSTFPPTTDLIVGPGFRKTYMPGYPEDPKSAIRESDYKGRHLREIDIAKEGNGLRIGGCEAMDFFGDGSFYLLHTPGHTVGHMCGLARVTTSPDTFIFMGADACHHGGEFRPTPYLPLPKTIPASLIPGFGGSVSGELLRKIQPNNCATEPFYRVARTSCHDYDEAVESIRKVQNFDANENVFVIIAHDMTLYDQLEYFPKTINAWKKTGIKERTRWAFVGDFKEALDEKAHL